MRKLEGDVHTLLGEFYPDHKRELLIFVLNNCEFLAAAPL